MKYLSIVFFLTLLFIINCTGEEQAIEQPRYDEEEILRDNQLLQQAEETGDVTYCDQVEDKLFCYAVVAHRTNNPLLCEQLEISARPGMPPEYFEATPKEFWVAQCYRAILSLGRLDPTICDKFPLPDQQEECRQSSGYYMKTEDVKRRALENRDPTICEELTGQTEEEYLAEHPHILEMKDYIENYQEIIEQYKQAGGTLEYRENNPCTISIEDALEVNDPLCPPEVLQDELAAAELEQSANPLEMDECLLDVARETMDEVVCGRIFMPEYQHDCYEEIAIEKQNPSLCDNLSNQEDQQGCFLTAQAVIAQDEQICSGITFSPHRDNCYILLAWKKQDRSLCDRLEHFEKSVCTAGFD